MDNSLEVLYNFEDFEGKRKKFQKWLNNFVRGLITEEIVKRHFNEKPLESAPYIKSRYHALRTWCDFLSANKDFSKLEISVYWVQGDPETEFIYPYADVLFVLNKEKINSLPPYPWAPIDDFFSKHGATKYEMEGRRAYRARDIKNVSKDHAITNNLEEDLKKLVGIAIEYLDTTR